MPEELAYARKASGLVRGLSFWDVLGIGLAFLTPIYAIWYVIGFSLSLFPRAQLVIAILISVVTVVWASPMVWGILGGTMPRSGGEYVYNSRIITPAVALGASFAAIVAQFYWNLFNASLLGVPSLCILGQYLGWTASLTSPSARPAPPPSRWSASRIAFLVVAFGMKRLPPPLRMGGRRHHRRRGDPQPRADLRLEGGLHPQLERPGRQVPLGQLPRFHGGRGKAAGAPMPHTWNWADTFGATAGVFMLVIWAFGIAYVGGEVKRPDKTVMMAQWAAVLAPAVLWLWAVLAINHLVDFSFLRAAAYQDYRDFGGRLRQLDGGLQLALLDELHVARLRRLRRELVHRHRGLRHLPGERDLAPDRGPGHVPARHVRLGHGPHGPRWFTSINHRFASPIGMYALVAGISAFMSIAYWYLFPSIVSGLVATGIQLVSVFGVTAISAIILPYRKKVSHIWETSPYRRWKLFGVPVLTIAGVVYLAYILSLIYFAFFDTRTRALGFGFTGKAVILMVCAWAAGIIWYYAWKHQSTKAGIDVAHLTYGELPPE